MLAKAYRIKCEMVGPGERRRSLAASCASP